MPNRPIDCNGVHWASVIVSAILPDKIALQAVPFCLGFLMDMDYQSRCEQGLIMMKVPLYENEVWSGWIFQRTRAYCHHVQKNRLRSICPSEKTSMCLCIKSKVDRSTVGVVCTSMVALLWTLRKVYMGL